MSKTNAGIPLNFGITYGFQSDDTYSLLSNAMPDQCILQFGRPVELDNIKTLNEFTSINRDTLQIGFTVLVKDTDPEQKGLQRSQYYWDGIEWIKFGNPGVSEYLNIFSIEYVKADPENNIDEGYYKTQFFMRMQIKNIQSNINLISLLNSRLIVTNLDIISYLGLNGNYSLENNGSTNILYSLINLNIRGGMNVLMKKISDKYNVTGRKFADLIEYTTTALHKIINQSGTEFIALCNEYNTLDVSMYINFIGACFASVKNLIINNSEDTVMLDPNNYLHMIDENVYNIITKSYTYTSGDTVTNTISSTSKVVQIQTYFTKLLNNINSIIHYNPNNPSSNKVCNFFKEIKNIIEYFKENNTVLFSRRTLANKFYSDLIEGIAGVITLALYCSIISTGDGLTRSTLFLHFLFPDKYKQIN